MDRIISGARAHARRRGSFTVTTRDVVQVGDKLLNKTPKRLKSPAEVLPEHFDRMVSDLQQLANKAAAMCGDYRPRVLIVGETSGVVAGMFKLAGMDVATCDLAPSERSDIPHYQGDATWIIDLGWNLIIAHPSCTYLSNAGITWLYRECDRFDALTDAAWQFRRIRNANSKLVVLENPKCTNMVKH